MLRLTLGLLLFFGPHSIRILAPSIRDRLVARLGAQGYRGVYSLVSVAGFALLVSGFAATRLTSPVLYTPPSWLREVAVVLLAPALPMLLAAFLPGRIQATLRHPMLAATKLWAFAHLLANGRLADLLLFGSFLAWAVADRVSIARRPPSAPPAGLPAGRFNDAIAIVAGLAFYAALIGGLHLRWFGVSPLG